jgi:hypothetical protein
MSNLQTKLFEQLEATLGTHISLTKWVAETLEIDYSVAHRKIAGQSRLQMNHFAKIIREYPHLLTSLFELHSASNLFFGNYHFYRNEQEVQQYFKRLLDVMDAVEKEDSTLKYFTHGWPLFLFLRDERLLDYKLSMWLNTLNSRGISKHKRETHALARTLFECYEDLSSEEIWHQNLCSNQLLQLQWNTQYGVLKKEEELQLKEAFTEMLARVQQWAEQGTKQRGSFDLMIGSFSTMPSGALHTQPNRHTLLTALQGTSHISTENPALIAHFNTQFDAHKSCSVSVSKVNALARADFFNTLRQEFTST